MLTSSWLFMLIACELATLSSSAGVLVGCMGNSSLELVELVFDPNISIMLSTGVPQTLGCSVSG